MRRLLRRLAWLVSRLVLVVALSFFVLAKATVRSAAPPSYSTDRLEESRLPVFFNAQPRDLEYSVNGILVRLARGGSDDDARELVRLGGAVFPLLLPRLALMPSTMRARVAWVLVPLAQRMTWRGANEIKSPTQAEEFLLDAWKERSVDFQPAIVARWVERLATRGSSTLMASVIEYDTFALPSLIAALPDVRTPDDVTRARQLLNVAHRITGLPWSIPAQASPEQARPIVDHWQRWWQLHAIDYTTVKGPSRWSAMLKQTQFGQWTALAFQHRFGTDRNGRPIASELASAGLRSLLLLLAGTVGTLTVTLFKRRTHRPASTPRLPLVTFALASIPHVSTVAVLAQLGVTHGLAAAAIVACVCMILLDLGNVDRLAEAPFDLANPVDTRAVRPRKALPKWLFAGHTWPFLLTLVFVVERAFDVEGLGQRCVEAFRVRDLHTLMAVTTLTALWLLLLEFAVQSNNPLRRFRGRSEHSP